LNPLDKFKRSAFLQNVSVMMGGTIIASVIPAIIQPILTRIYTADDIGLYNLYFYFIGTFTCIASLRYDLAVPLPDNKEDTDRVAILSLIMSAIVSSLLMIPAYFFRFEIAALLNSPRMSFWILIVPAGVFFGGVYQTFNYWLIRHQAFKASAINRISQKITDSALMVGLGYMKISGGQIIGEFTGRVALGFTALFQSVNKGFTFKSYDAKRIRQLASKYRDFPLFNSLPALADSIGLYIPGMFISSFFGEAETGYYGITRFVLSIPLIIISRNIAQVLFERYAAKRNQQQPVYHEVKKLFLYLIVATVPFVLILVLFAPALFAFVFGDEWRISGEYTQILALSYALRFVNGSITVVFSALEKIRVASYWQMYFFIVICSLGFLKYFDVTMVQFLWILMLVESVSYIIYIYLGLRVSKDYDKSLKVK
jgi:O-antigen/teichoic acid export membrane protein